MKAEIISVGTELLLGHTINSDATYVARELAALGVDLMHVHTVGDNVGRLESALRDALSRSDLVVTTGGLGPTEDDLTKETAARVAGAPLREHAESVQQLLEYFGERPMSANQRKQAFLPEGCTAFANKEGTAPGCAVPVRSMPGNKIIIMLPGPPSELIPMLRGQVTPYLQQMCGEAIASFMVRVFGMGEGPAALRIADLTHSLNPTAATYASDGEMFVRVTAKAENAAAAEALAAPMITAVRERLGDVVYGVDVENLESTVVDELIRRKLTLATAESCTGGLLASRITDRPGASSVFETGLVTYADAAKIQLLAVPEEMLRVHGAVSEDVACCMAENVRTRYGADLGVGITGIAGPDGGSDAKPVGLVYIAVSDGQTTHRRAMRPQGRYLGRAWTRRRAVNHALDMLRRYLTGLPVG